MPGRLGLVSAAAALAVALLLGSVGAEADGGRSGAVPRERNCFWQLANGKGRDLVCDYPAFLTDQERTDLKALTRELIQDASCLVSVRIERRLVDEAVKASDHEFKSPPQRVTCNVFTKDSVVPISGTFSPRVLLKDGRAVEATPTLGDVQGVHAALAWPVVQYVNRSTTIRDGMIEMINAYLDRRRQQASVER